MLMKFLNDNIMCNKYNPIWKFLGCSNVNIATTSSVVYVATS